MCSLPEQLRQLAFRVRLGRHDPRGPDGLSPPWSQRDHAALGKLRLGSTAGTSMQRELVRFRNPVLPGWCSRFASEWKAVFDGQIEDETDLGLDFMPLSLLDGKIVSEVSREACGSNAPDADERDLDQQGPQRTGKDRASGELFCRQGLHAYCLAEFIFPTTP